jgi:hypothetical protein
MGEKGGKATFGSSVVNGYVAPFAVIRQVTYRRLKTTQAVLRRPVLA